MNGSVSVIGEGHNGFIYCFANLRLPCCAVSPGRTLTARPFRPTRLRTHLARARVWVEAWWALYTLVRSLHVHTRVQQHAPGHVHHTRFF
ncbi:hypothetical protein E2C01_055742 [Portunus trituberculatus]|uniref:Uncharacterized protein n=1 Tax=Portunus trituberculatus TaxID=210409 RepID=A0A5B7GWS6_PORTR|nr:hypothetical protein [Portunus trituberculatus]